MAATQSSEGHGTPYDPTAWPSPPTLLAQFCDSHAVSDTRAGGGSSWGFRWVGPALGASPGKPDGGGDARSTCTSTDCPARWDTARLILSLTLPSSSCVPRWQRFKSRAVNPKAHSEGTWDSEGQERMDPVPNQGVSDALQLRAGGIVCGRACVRARARARAGMRVCVCVCV